MRLFVLSKDNKEEIKTVIKKDSKARSNNKKSLLKNFLKLNFLVFFIKQMIKARQDKR